MLVTGQLGWHEEVKRRYMFVKQRYGACIHHMDTLAKSRMVIKVIKDAKGEEVFIVVLDWCSSNDSFPSFERENHWCGVKDFKKGYIYFGSAK